MGTLPPVDRRRPTPGRVLSELSPDCPRWAGDGVDVCVVVFRVGQYCDGEGRVGGGPCGNQTVVEAGALEMQHDGPSFLPWEFAVDVRARAAGNCVRQVRRHDAVADLTRDGV